MDQAHFSDPSVIQDSLNLLAEVADYLSRLPPVPVTRDLERKVRSHLSNPSVTKLARRAKTATTEQETMEQIKAGMSLEGTYHYAPNGLPELIAQLRYPVLRLEAPATYVESLKSDNDADKMAWEIGVWLTHGVEIQLAPQDLNFRGVSKSGRIVDLD